MYSDRSLEPSFISLMLAWGSFLAARIRRAAARDRHAERIAAIVAASGHPPGA